MYQIPDGSCTNGCDKLPLTIKSQKWCHWIVYFMESPSRREDEGRQAHSKTVVSFTDNDLIPFLNWIFHSEIIHFVQSRLSPGVLTTRWDAAVLREEVWCAQREGGVVRTDIHSHLSLSGFNPTIPIYSLSWFFSPRCCQLVATSLTPTQTAWAFYLLWWVDTGMDGKD